MANLRLVSVGKIYPSGTLALHDINLELADSEFIAVVGGEKSGKSTLLRIIAGLEGVTGGEVYVGDKDVTHAPAKDRDIAMIFQGNSLYPSFTVAENIAYGLKLRKASPALIDRRVRAVAEMLGLTDILGRRPKAITAEQRQKVAFARAIVREPQLYLLDDPLGGLDPALRDSLRSVLVNIQARMRGTFVYATKSVPEAISMASRILVLREGMMQQIDTPANLYDYPANAYVAFLIGSPSVNFVNGARIVKKDGAYFAVKDELSLALPENIVKRFVRIDEYVESQSDVILGLRPEDMQADKEGLFSALVTDTEEVCGVTYASCDCGDHTFVVRAEGATKGDSIDVSADLKHMLIFDAVSRLTLLERDEGYAKTGLPDSDRIPLAFNEEEAVKQKHRASRQSGDKKKKKR